MTIESIVLLDALAILRGICYNEKKKTMGGIQDMIRKYTETMTSRERVLRTFNFEKTDRVTIGYENRGERKGAPTIKGRCWIGTNAVVVGKVTIGEDVMIAPLTFVNFDVPEHSIVIGNPAKIIHKENATQEYICNEV